MKDLFDQPDEKRPMKHADHPMLEMVRLNYPYQVCVDNWREYSPEGKAKVYKLAEHHCYDSAWSDYLGTKTFGFENYMGAQDFARAMQTSMIIYVPRPLAHEEGPMPPSPPPYAYDGPESSDRYTF